jgi:hypothetical protein
VPTLSSIVRLFKAIIVILALSILANTIYHLGLWILSRNEQDAYTQWSSSHQGLLIRERTLRLERNAQVLVSEPIRFHGTPLIRATFGPPGSQSQQHSFGEWIFPDVLAQVSKHEFAFFTVRSLGIFGGIQLVSQQPSGLPDEILTSPVSFRSYNYIRIVCDLLLPAIPLVLLRLLIQCRKRANRCKTCGYCLDGLRSPRCPECGNL